MSQETRKNEYKTFFDAAEAMKKKLYDGDYYTMSPSCIYVAYNRNKHRFQVFTTWGNGRAMDEEPRCEEFSTIRLLEIKTDHELFDGAIEDIIRENPIDAPREEQEQLIIDDFISNAGSELIQREPEVECAELETEVIEDFIETELKKQSGLIRKEQIIPMLTDIYDIPQEVAEKMVPLILEDCRVAVDTDPTRQQEQEDLLRYVTYRESA